MEQENNPIINGEIDDTMEQENNLINDDLDYVLPSNPFYDFTETQNNPNSSSETHDDPLPKFSSLSLSDKPFNLPLLPSSSSASSSSTNTRTKGTVSPPPLILETSLSSFNECMASEGMMMRRREHGIHIERFFNKVLRNPWQVMTDAAVKSSFCEFIKVINQTMISKLVRVLVVDVEKFTRTCCNVTG